MQSKTRLDSYEPNLALNAQEGCHCPLSHSKNSSLLFKERPKRPTERLAEALYELVFVLQSRDCNLRLAIYGRFRSVGLDRRAVSRVQTLFSFFNL
jgi:hypothetical protein